MKILQTSFDMFSYIILVSHTIHSRIKNYKNFRYLLIVILYTILAILFTYPVAFTVGTSIPGGGDAYYWINSLWYTDYALSHPDITSLSHNNMMFYPHGAAITPFPSAYNQIIYLLLVSFADPQVIYSLLWLSTFVIGSAGAFFLIRYLTGNEYAAFVGGFVYGFSPYHFSRALFFFGAANIQWIPLCVLFTLKMKDDSSFKNILLASFFFILVAMSDLQYMVYISIFLGFIFLYSVLPFFLKKKDWPYILDIIKKFLFFGIIAFIGILPITINDINTAYSGQNYLKPEPGAAVILSNDLLSFFIPSHLHPVFTGYVQDYYSSIYNWVPEKVNFIGLTVLLLCIYAVYMRKSQIEVIFWGLMAALFTVLSLGPVLKINGSTTIPFIQTTIPLPYILFTNIVPFLDHSRTAGRLFVIGTLCIAVLVGYAIASIRQERYSGKCLSVALAVMIGFSYLSVPYPVSDATIPQFYKEISHDSDRYAIMKIPLSKNSHGLDFETFYYQTTFQKSVVGGYLARYPPGTMRFIDSNPLINSMYYLTEKNDIHQNFTENAVESLNYNNIRYIIVWPSELTLDEFEFVNNTLSEKLGFESMYYPDGQILVYSVPIVPPPKPFIFLDNGWNDHETWHGIPSRWIKNESSVSILSPYSANFTLRFRATAYTYDQILTVSSANLKENSSFFIVNNSFTDIQLPLTLEKGRTNLTFIPASGAIQPCSITGLNSTDKRFISIGIQELRITEQK